MADRRHRQRALAARPSGPTAPVRSGRVVALGSRRSDADIVEGLRAGEPWARGALFDQYGPMVERIVRRLVAVDPDIDHADLVHDAFVGAYLSIGSLRDSQALCRWMQVIAARTVYRHLRARRARRWLRFWAPTELPEPAAPAACAETREACRRAYRILQAMPAAERVPFGLRYIEGLELSVVAEACEVSLATIKRRLARAGRRFTRLARRDELLCPWLAQGGRWPS